MTKPSYIYVTYIRASVEKVWSAITDRDITEHYWAHWNVSDWTVGAKWDHQRCDGSNVVDITGTVVESRRPQRLVITWANPSEAAQPENVSRVTFEIAPHIDGVTRLTVTHDELKAGSSMEKGITNGWPIVLSSLKSWLETGKAVPFVRTCSNAQ